MHFFGVILMIKNILGYSFGVIFLTGLTGLTGFFALLVYLIISLNANS